MSLNRWRTETERQLAKLSSALNWHLCVHCCLECWYFKLEKFQTTVKFFYVENTQVLFLNLYVLPLLICHSAVHPLPHRWQWLLCTFHFPGTCIWWLHSACTYEWDRCRQGCQMLWWEGEVLTVHSSLTSFYLFCCYVYRLIHRYEGQLLL